MTTLQSYCSFVSNSLDERLYEQAREYIGEYYSEHIDFLSSLPLYYEDLNHIYVHAGLNPNYLNWREQPEHDFMYIKGEFHRSRNITDKKVIFGHTRTIELQDSAAIWFYQDK